MRWYSFSQCWKSLLRWLYIVFFGKRGTGTNCTNAQMFKISILMMPQRTRVFEWSKNAYWARSSQWIGTWISFRSLAFRKKSPNFICTLTLFLLSVKRHLQILLFLTPDDFSRQWGTPYRVERVNNTESQKLCPVNVGNTHQKRKLLIPPKFMYRFCCSFIIWNSLDVYAFPYNK